MTLLALLLVLGAAVLYASWNYLLKRLGGGAVFVSRFATLSTLIYAPPAILVVWWVRPVPDWEHVGLVRASVALQLVAPRRRNKLGLVWR